MLPTHPQLRLARERLAALYDKTGRGDDAAALAACTNTCALPAAAGAAQ